MVCHNDDLLDPGAGYPDHPHRDLEIVTWVLSGALVHTDGDGRHHVLEPGRAQVLSAGSGVRHSEIADAASGPTRFVQVWVHPDEPGGVPAYAASGTGDLRGAGLVEVAGGSGLPLGRRGASLSVADVAAGEELVLPDAPLLHVFSATGSFEVEGEGPLRLHVGDAVRLTDSGRARVRGREPGQLLVWSFEV